MMRCPESLYISMSLQRKNDPPTGQMLMKFLFTNMVFSVVRFFSFKTEMFRVLVERIVRLYFIDFSMI